MWYVSRTLPAKSILMMQVLQNVWTPSFRVLNIVFTSRHDSLQMNDIRMVKLSHNAGFTQEVTPLLLSVAHFECLDGNWHIPFSRQLQSATAHLSKLSCVRWNFMSEVESGYKKTKKQHFKMTNLLVYFETKQLCRAGIQIGVWHLVILRGMQPTPIIRHARDA